MTPEWLKEWIVIILALAGSFVMFTNAKGRKERLFMIKAIVLLWVGVLPLAFCLMQPLPYRLFALIPGIALCVGYYYGFKKWEALKASEQKDLSSKESES